MPFAFYVYKWFYFVDLFNVYKTLL